LAPLIGGLLPVTLRRFALYRLARRLVEPGVRVAGGLVTLVAGVAISAPGKEAVR
jgi:hypothetical protein